MTFLNPRCFGGVDSPYNTENKPREGTKRKIALFSPIRKNTRTKRGSVFWCSLQAVLWPFFALAILNGGEKKIFFFLGLKRVQK